jgi:hypothetical protein
MSQVPLAQTFAAVFLGRTLQSLKPICQAPLLAAAFSGALWAGDERGIVTPLMAASTPKAVVRIDALPSRSKTFGTCGPRALAQLGHVGLRLAVRAFRSSATQVGGIGRELVFGAAPKPVRDVPAKPMRLNAPETELGSSLNKPFAAM